MILKHIKDTKCPHCDWPYREDREIRNHTNNVEEIRFFQCGLKLHYNKNYSSKVFEEEPCENSKEYIEKRERRNVAYDSVRAFISGFNVDEKFKKEITTLRLGKGESYGIPYRTLTPKGLNNVLVAGRCVSTDRNLQASIRVMPGCYITGQAAGMATALMIESDTDSRGIDIRELQNRLKAIGAFLPNC